MKQENKTRDNIIHVMCIGGSGLRVFKSLIMQLATGIDIENYKIKPYIVDPHIESKEMEQISDMLRYYKELHAEGKNHGFFKTPIEFGTITDLNVMKTSEIITQSFKDFTAYESHKVGSMERYLIDMLYSTTNLDKSMSVGFKGSPNVGSVVFELLVESDWFKNKFNPNKGDKVVLIGSVFGGTGASGIPTITRGIKSKGAHIPVYAIPIMPYFKLAAPEDNTVEQDISSEVFETKALAALEYYKQTNEDIDSFYAIGDKLDKGYKYDEKVQGNDAHLVEFLAATAISHLASRVNNDDGGEEVNKKWNLLGIENNATNMAANDWGDSYDKYLFALADFYIFSKFLS
ncbi:MAG: hypothetical protein LIP01_00280 [Tannerellaceae bacterium]|nr:hypothetical protein [Tannerellaceae bacterium]